MKKGEVTMMRKATRFLALVMASAVLLSACGASRAKSPEPDPDKVAVYSESGEGCRAFYCPTVASLMEMDRLVCVVYGEVVDYYYFEEKGQVYTTEIIRVLETLYGDVEAGEELPMWKGGGYATFEDLLDSCPGEELREEYRSFYHSLGVADEEFGTRYYHRYIKGDVEPKIGARSIFFLEYEFVEEGLYDCVSGSDGEYAQMKNGRFLKSWEMYQVEEIRAMINGDQETVDRLQAQAFTYDEIMEQINAAMK